MAKKKSPEKVESKSHESDHAIEAVEVGPGENEHIDMVDDSDADIAKHPKFDKFKSHGGN